MSEFKVSIVIPALNEEKTIANIVSSFVALKNIEEVIVAVDSKTIDSTAKIAIEAGAVVLPNCGTGLGNVFKAGIEKAKSDLIIRMDGDIEEPDSNWVGLLMAAYKQYEAPLIKTYWDYSVKPRMTTILAIKPLLNILYPHLAHLKQPISGIYLFDRRKFNFKSMGENMSIDIDMVLQVSRKSDDIQQVEIGSIVDRYKKPEQLAFMSEQIMDQVITAKKNENLYPNITFVFSSLLNFTICALGTALKHASYDSLVSCLILSNEEPANDYLLSERCINVNQYSISDVEKNGSEIFKVISNEITKNNSKLVVVEDVESLSNITKEVVSKLSGKSIRVYSCDFNQSDKNSNARRVINTSGFYSEKIRVINSVFGVDASSNLNDKKLGLQSGVLSAEGFQPLLNVSSHMESLNS